MDSHSDFTARWLHISCILTHHSFSKLLNSSVKLMPFSLFGLISIRIWMYHMRLLWSEFQHKHTFCFSHVFLQRDSTRVFPDTAAAPWQSGFQCLAEGLFGRDCWYLISNARQLADVISLLYPSKDNTFILTPGFEPTVDLYCLLLSLTSRGQNVLFCCRRPPPTASCRSPVVLEVTKNQLVQI